MRVAKFVVRSFGGAVLAVVGLFFWLLCAWFAMWIVEYVDGFSDIDGGQMTELIGIGILMIVGICSCATGGWLLAPLLVRRAVSRSALVRVLLFSPVIAACSIVASVSAYFYL